jgi:hypothetical protein
LHCDTNEYGVFDERTKEGTHNQPRRFHSDACDLRRKLSGAGANHKHLSAPGGIARKRDAGKSDGRLRADVA